MPTYEEVIKDMVEKEKAITIRGQALELTPDEVVAGATVQARLLMDIVEKTNCYQVIANKKYLQVEAWETIGAFNRTHAETESIAPIIKDNETIGYQARVQLWKDGVVVGGAVMPCYFTENCCKGKEGDAKHKACMSAAQTFATSKAYRMNFSYVAILAGYQPLPAEEVTEDMKQDTTEHWCEEHQTNFFKRGKMKSYAHPIGDTGGWCHEHTPESPQSTRKPSKAETGALPNANTEIPVEDKAAELAEQVKDMLEKDETPINREQINRLTDLLTETDTSREELSKWMVKKGWKVSKMGDIKVWQFEEILKAYGKG